MPIYRAADGLRPAAGRARDAGGRGNRKMGISKQTFYRWKKKFGGLMPSEVRKLRQLEEENAQPVWLVLSGLQRTRWAHDD